MMDTKEVVRAATDQLFVDRDPAAVDRWVAPEYKQHSTMAGDGPEAIRQLVAGLPPDFRYEPARVIADGDTVALHGTYHGLGPQPLVAFDIFRVEDDKLAEHWDALTPVVSETVNGHSQVDGPTEVTDRDRTEANRRLVKAFMETVLQAGKIGRITEYVATRYVQHNPAIGDNIDGLATAMRLLAEQGRTLRYDKVHRIIAEGNLVLAVSEGSFGDTPTAFYDLFRIENGRIVEHWDATPEIPAQLPHNNGVF